MYNLVSRERQLFPHFVARFHHLAAAMRTRGPNQKIKKEKEERAVAAERERKKEKQSEKRFGLEFHCLLLGNNNIKQK